MDEYADLLLDNYPFKYSDDYKSYTWILYTGSLPITTLNSTINGNKYNIEIVLGSDKNGTTSIEFHLAKEIVLVDPRERFDIPDEPDKDVYGVPDFLSFADGFATQTKVDENDRYSQYYYTLPQGAYPVEYQYEELLTSNYSYELIDSKTLEANNQRQLYYFFKYTDSQISQSLVSTFPDGTTVSGYHVRILLTITNNADLTLTITLHGSFEFESHYHKTDFTGNRIPDFSYWADGIVYDSDQGEYENDLQYLVCGVSSDQVSSSEWNTIFNEYCNLIKNQYFFELEDNDDTSIDGTVYHNYWFTYSGEGDVDLYYETKADGSRVNFNMCAYWWMSGDDYMIEIAYPQGLELDIPLFQSANIT